MRSASDRRARKERCEIRAALSVVEDRPFCERPFHVTEGVFVELFGLGMFDGVEGADEGCGVRIMGELEVARDAGIALLQSSDRPVDLVGFDELCVGDASRQFVDVGAQTAYLLGADGAIFGDALLTAAEHVGVLTVGTGLDLDRGLVLTRVERGRLVQHGDEPFGVLEVAEPAVAPAAGWRRRS